jgi:asparagine synthase (glutamine-hydrolysing)
MCGFAGELRLDASAHSEAIAADLARMLAVLAPRGPDDVGEWHDARVTLGHRRLSILDLSTLAHQPFVDDATGCVLVFNGTLYNYRELRHELQALGHVFRSTGDTEVLLRAWLQWGRQAPERFLGMFAFALWDPRAQKLFLARDRFGIKPLYLSRQAGRLRFASTLPALLAGGGVDTRLDAEAIQFQFSLHGVVPAPRTLLQGVRKLEPAHVLEVDAQTGREQLHRFWHLEAERPALAMNAREWQAEVHEALVRSVRRRVEASDVPVGVLLSGGLDSSLIVALLAEETDVHDLHTFSIGFEDMPEEKGSEFEYSDQVVARFNTRHHRITIPNDQVLARLPDAVQHMSEPMFAQDAVAFYLLAEQVAKDVKVVQSGQGADEVFAGYFWYGQMQADGLSPAAQRFAKFYVDRSHNEWTRMVQGPWQGRDLLTPWLTQELTRPKASEFLDQVLRLDVTTLIVDDPVKRVDNMTMAWGLEARVPFLDHELVELVAQMPPALKLAEGGKGILKQVSRGRVPDAVIDRPKGYFPMPALKYVRGEFLDFMRGILDSQACRERGLYDRRYVDALLAEPTADSAFTPIRGSKLWQLALFEFWLQRHHI